jgi:putative addiction module component (TIGR02574 family)
MESIVLQVPESVAKPWKNSSADVKSHYERRISDLLRELQEAEFDNLLDRAGKIAKDNGLTEEQLAIINQDAGDERYEWWNDEEMVAELDRRSEELRSGKVKGIPWEDVKARLLSRSKKNEL